VLRGERESAVVDIDGARALGAALADDLLARGANRFATTADSAGVAK
jgi:hypothetical protein